MSMTVMNITAQDAQAFITKVNTERNREFTVEEKIINGVKIISAIEKKEGRNIAPSIRLNDFLEPEEDYKNNDEVVERFVQLYDRALENAPSISLEMINSRDYILNNVYVRAINKNRTLSYSSHSTEPLFSVENIDLYPYIDMKQAGIDGVASLSKEMMETYGIEKEELYEAIKNNMLESMNLFKFVTPYMDDNFEGPFLNVLTNKEKFQGAGMMGFPEVMRKAEEKLGFSKFYIIPSSVHELILLEATDESDETIAGMKAMIKEVNQSDNVAETEYLSDDLYIYENGKISICK